MRTSITALLCGIFAFSAVTALSQTPGGEFQVKAGGKTITFAEMAAQLEKADVVFVGEQHDHKQGHELELVILQDMQAQKRPVALSLEMFERDVQPVVDEYLADFISESQFMSSSRPWPTYKTDYRPLVEFCKANHLSLVAANPPRRYVNMVSRKGPDALLKLNKESRVFLPKLPYSIEIPKGYDEALAKVFDAPHAAGAAQTMPGMPSVQNLKCSQMLRDTGMADSIANFVRKHRGTRVLQMNGSMHSDFRFGIVDRLQRQSPNLKVVTITIKPEAGYPNTLSDAAAPNAADFVIITPEVSGPQ
ncbi:MAG: ChaN family lipoprotein [Chthonomonadales bacterium]